jgi:hypothetical protein
MPVTHDRDVDPGHIEGAVMSLGGLRQDQFHSKICAPTRIAGVSASHSVLAGTPNRRT